jgi:hypothetical protein
MCLTCFPDFLNSQDILGDPQFSAVAPCPLDSTLVFLTLRLALSFWVFPNYLIGVALLTLARNVAYLFTFFFNGELLG